MSVENIKVFEMPVCRWNVVGKQVSGVRSQLKFSNCGELVNRCACDVLSHIYQPSWEHHSQWSRAYPGAEEIGNVYKSLSENYQISELLHLKHRVVGAEWNESGQS